MSVIGTKVRPIPIEASMIPGSRSVTYVPSGWRRMKSSSPTIAIGIPISGTSRAPSFGTRLCDRPAPMMIPAVNGRKARPASSARVSEHALEVERVEVEHREEPGRDEEHHDVRGAHRSHAEDVRRTSGSAERRSITTNAASSTIASAKKPPVCSDVQPFSCALTIP